MDAERLRNARSSGVTAKSEVTPDQLARDLRVATTERPALQSEQTVHEGVRLIHDTICGFLRRTNLPVNRRDE